LGRLASLGHHDEKGEQTRRVTYGQLEVKRGLVAGIGVRIPMIPKDLVDA